MATAAQRRRRHVKRILARRNRYQFGQPAKTTNLVSGGSFACTDTCIQLIVWMAKGKKPTLNEVRRRSGGPQGSARYTPGMRGLRPSEALRALKSYGLDYELKSLSARDALRVARNKGPVIIAEQYWAHPQWKGYRYAGRTLRGWATSSSGKRIRVGHPRRKTQSGLTQWTFRGNHAVLLATAFVAGLDNVEKSTGLVRDPNHNSSVRSERPKWDTVTPQQLNRMMDSIRGVYYGRRLVYVPKRKVINA